LTYVSLLCIISANDEKYIMSESMVTEKEIINSLRNVLRDLFKSIDFIKLIDIQSEVKTTSSTSRLGLI